MVLESEPRPTLVLNPPDDGAFRTSAEQLVESGIAEPSILESRLRQRWPRALVRPRELAGEQSQIWYVYRDGHWVRPGVPTGRAEPDRSSSQEGRHEQQKPPESA